MTTRREATPRRERPTARKVTSVQTSSDASRSARQQAPARQEQRSAGQARAAHTAEQSRAARPTSQSQGTRQASSRQASPRTRATDSRRRAEQSRQGQERKRTRQGRRPAKRRSSVDLKVVAIVAISLAVVLGVAGFFAQRRGLLDWTGIGMRKVALEVRAEGFDDEATPIPLHINGTRSSGVSYDRDFYITAGQESIKLPQGKYQVAVTASPIASGGSLYVIPEKASSVTIEGRDVSVLGNSAGAIVLNLSHLDIIDATDAQVDAAIAAAQASGGKKKASEVVERNVPALQRLRQQSVLPDDMPASLVLESTMSGWTTTVTILADGSFSGTYTQLVSSAASGDYPNGTAYTSIFSGTFSDVERLGETGFRMTLGEVALDHELGEKWVEDGVLNVASQPIGFETGSTFELWRPGTSTEDLGWWLSAWCNDYANTGVPEELDRWALDNVDASYGFFSEAPKTAATADSGGDADAGAATPSGSDEIN